MPPVTSRASPKARDEESKNAIEHIDAGLHFLSRREGSRARTGVSLCAENESWRQRFSKQARAVGAFDRHESAYSFDFQGS